MRVLKEHFGKVLRDLLESKGVSRVDIATAWATEGEGLDALEEANVKVRALVGTSGNHTTPEALKRLQKLGSVRLVEDNAGLFHVKLYLFRAQQRTSLAWIGSANFTGPGFGSNEELVLETSATGATSHLQAWFDKRWRSVGPQAQADRDLKDYCRKWKPPAAPLLGVAEHDLPAKNSKNSPPSARGTANEIRFEQCGERPPPHLDGDPKLKRSNPEGYVTVAGKRHHYTSAMDATIAVLEELQRQDATFLERCWNSSEFPRGRGGNRYVARGLAELGSLHLQKFPKWMKNGWVMSSQPGTPTKWEIVVAAAKIAGLRVCADRMWAGQQKRPIKVGF